MIAYIVRRMLLAVLTLFVISVFAYIVVQLPPGDTVDLYLRSVSGMGTNNRETLAVEEVEKLRKRFGLDRPIMVRYMDWVSGILLRGDFGDAYFFGPIHPVRPVIARELPYTIYLSLFTIVITWSFAIPIGIYSALRQHSIGDYVFTFLGFAGLAVPDFLLGLVMMYVAYVYFDHKVGGIFSGEYVNAPWSIARVMDMLQHLIIPGIVLGTSGTAALIRIMRNNLLDELRKPYVVTAQAKGLPSWKVVLKYPVRVAINPFVSGIGSTLPALVSGSVIVSIVLSLPTLGPTMLEAITRQEAELVGALVLLFSTLTVVGTLISDLLLVIVDPRIKLTGSARGGGGGV